MSGYVDPVEWEATVEYSDGSLASLRFKLERGDDERRAKRRAYDIWRLARCGSDGSFLNPTLKVALVEAAPKAVPEPKVARFWDHDARKFLTIPSKGKLA